MQNSAPQQLILKRAYEECLSRERVVLKQDFHPLKLHFFKVFFFGRPHSMIDPELDFRASPESHDLKIRQGLWWGSKYRDLLDLVRNTNGKETFWLVIAWWLKQEGVCEPEEFLPKGFLEAAANKFFRGFSFTDIRHASLVDTWRPDL